MLYNSQDNLCYFPSTNVSIYVCVSMKGLQ